MVNFNRRDLTGQRFGKLTILGFCENYGKGNYKLLCKCDCGIVREIGRSSITSGLTKSCGCMLKKHGMRNTRFYTCWMSLKQRCRSDKCYTEKNISYDTRWEEFSNFYEDMYPTYNDTLELDRIDPNGNYCKENCRWVTESTQAFNQSKSKFNTSGRTGVYFLRKKNKWRASISFNNVVVYLYQGSSYEDACAARESAELKYFGEIKK